MQQSQPNGEESHRDDADASEPKILSGAGNLSSATKWDRDSEEKTIMSAQEFRDAI